MQPPNEWTRTLALLGTNRFGDPTWRMVWGPERTEWRGGLHSDFDSNTGLLIRRVAEMRLCPKYGKQPIWILERWLPPENYGSPERWRIENLDLETGLLTLGPYPTRGEYEACFPWATVEDYKKPDGTIVPKGTEIPPTADMIQCLVKMILATQGMSDKLKKSAMLTAIRRGDDAHKKKVRDVFQEAKEDVALHVGMRPSRLNDVPVNLGVGQGPTGLIQLTDKEIHHGNVRSS